MFTHKEKIISILLASAMITPVLCACSIDTAQSIETTLPTTSETSLPTLETTMETTETTKETTAATEPGTVETAPSSEELDTSYVRLIDGVEPEMMNADYWIGEDDNIILMTDEEIAAYNHENRGNILSADEETQMPHLDEFEDTLDGDILRTFLNDNANSVPGNPRSYYLDGTPTSSIYWENLVDLSNIDQVPDVIEVRYGYTVKRMTLRMFPTEDRIFKDPDDKYFDALLYSECMPYMPCVVLHESSDGEYYYVVFDSYSAWVRKDAVALCEDKEDWLARQNPDQWLVVTGREIRFGTDPHCEAVSDLVLPMGTQMELVSAEDAPEVINQRTTYGDYVVKVPTRGSDGYIEDEYVLIPMSDDVHVGFLPYTPANIVRQAFKLLGDRYGWGGDLEANDCTGITREVYRCFGILLPRVKQSASTGVYSVDVSDMSDEDKLYEIGQLTPGSLIAFPGHMMIYLGMVDGVPYVISAVGTFVAPAPGSDEQIHPDSVIVNSLYVRRASLKTWLESVTVVLTIKPD